MQATHNGVLIPVEMRNASPAELDAYAAHVKAGNRAFRDAYFALQSEMEHRGIIGWCHVCNNDIVDPDDHVLGCEQYGKGTDDPNIA